MDIPEPPKIVFEAEAPCADVAATESLLRRTLAPSLAPRAGWTVAMRVIRVEGSLQAEGEIIDDVGAPTAHRQIRKAEGSECASLGRALGVWATLVLDAEVERARRSSLAARTELNSIERERPEVLWPAPAISEPSSPEAQLFLLHPKETRSLELGAGGWFMSSPGFGGVAGASIVAVVEVPSGWFLRPMVLFGRGISLERASVTYAGGRFDLCRRFPGNYRERRGIQADVCGGADVGITSREAVPAKPVTIVGTSFGLRGELASALAVEFRGVVGWVAPDPELAGRLELAMTWRAR